MVDINICILFLHYYYIAKNIFRSTFELSLACLEMKSVFTHLALFSGLAR